MPQLPLIDLAAEGVSYKVDFGFRDSASPDESNFGNDSPATVVRRFLVTPWSKRHIFIRWMLGEVAINEDSSPVSLTRTPTQRHPLYLSLFAHHILAVKGFKQAPNRPAVGAGTRVYTLTDYDQSGGGEDVDYKLAEYESAIVDVEYQHPRYRPMGDGEYKAVGFTEEYQRHTEMLDPTASGDYLTLPGMSLKFTRQTGTNPPHGKSIPYGIGKVLPLEEFTMVWRRVPYEVYQDGKIDGDARSPLHKRIYGDPWATGSGSGTGTRYPYLGTVNAFPIFGRPAETLLFSKFSAVRRYGPIPTTWEWDLHYTFTMDPFRWNWKYNFDSRPIGNPFAPNQAGWFFSCISNNYPATATDPDFGDFLDTPDDDALYNTRNFAYLFRPGVIA